MPKRSGKTTLLLRAMKEDPSLYYVAHTAAAALWAYKRAKDLGLEIPRSRFLSATDRKFPVIAQTNRGARLAVDELELTLSALFQGLSVAAVTTSPDNNQGPSLT